MAQLTAVRTHSEKTTEVAAVYTPFLDAYILFTCYSKTVSAVITLSIEEI